MTEEVKYYMPSNGSEGDCFTSMWCERCRKDTTFRKENGKVFCGILTKSLIGKQPKQWIYDENRVPQCLSFVNYQNYKPKSRRSKKGQLSFQFPDTLIAIRFDDMKEYFDLHHEPTNKEICMMCHFSSQCDKCCKNCKEKCNSCQHCQILIGEQSDRLTAWMNIVLNNENFKHLKKYIVLK